jgi:4a-hydroxytetrahydrobiopterin dehydratase
LGARDKQKETIIMLISPDEINKSLSNYGWKCNNKKITKSYSFKKYINSIDFVQKIAELAEKNHHHPNIHIGWCKVDISITSHDLGGVTTNCINLAIGIDYIFENLQLK